MIVLDTDILSILQRGSGADYERLVPQLARYAGEEAALTIISFEEQTRGWLAQLAKNKRPDDQVAPYLRFHRLLDDYARWRVWVSREKLPSRMQASAAPFAGMGRPI